MQLHGDVGGAQHRQNAPRTRVLKSDMETVAVVSRGAWHQGSSLGHGLFHELWVQSTNVEEVAGQIARSRVAKCVFARSVSSVGRGMHATMA